MFASVEVAVVMECILVSLLLFLKHHLAQYLPFLCRYYLSKLMNHIQLPHIQMLESKFVARLLLSPILYHLMVRVLNFGDNVLRCFLYVNERSKVMLKYLGNFVFYKSTPSKYAEILASAIWVFKWNNERYLRLINLDLIWVFGF